MFLCGGFWERGFVCLGPPCPCCWWKGFWPWCDMGRGSLRFICWCCWWGISCLWWWGCCWCMEWGDKGSWCVSWLTGGVCNKPCNGSRMHTHLNKHFQNIRFLHSLLPCNTLSTLCRIKKLLVFYCSIFSEISQGLVVGPLFFFQQKPQQGKKRGESPKMPFLEMPMTSSSTELSFIIFPT